MDKKLLILSILLILWAILSIINFAKAAESPMSKLDVPVEIASDPVKSYAYVKVAQAFGSDHWNSFNNIIIRESQWNPLSQNPTSSAFGLGQFLNSTWKGTGFEKTNDPYVQIDATIQYIIDRYDNPNLCWKFWVAHAWY